MPAKLGELQNQLVDLQTRIDMLEKRIHQNDDFALGINDLLVLFAEQLIEA